MEIINRNRLTALAEMVRNPADLMRVGLGINRALEISFAHEARESLIARPISHGEIKRRFEICEKWFQIMRADCGYSVDKAIDFLPRALQSDLDGVAFEPPKNLTGWSPDVLAEHKEL